MSHPPNLTLADGSVVHVHLLMECWSCEHTWWDCSNDETVNCPSCGEGNWAREPVHNRDLPLA